MPGQVSWDWWNDYNLTHVDFRAGMNTKTFEHFIDFAAENHARYVILDGGWSDTFDLDKVNPDVDLPAILAHATEKNVGVILWATWYAITQQMNEVFPRYAAMGVKGWKIDFIDRDDQVAVESTYEIAKLAAKYKMTVDYHGVFKPTGLQRTYPNVVGYEGVYGLENFKWAYRDAPPARRDHPLHAQAGRSHGLHVGGHEERHAGRLQGQEPRSHGEGDAVQPARAIRRLRGAIPDVVGQPFHLSAGAGVHGLHHQRAHHLR